MYLSKMRFIAIVIAFGAHLARCAVDINGNPVTEPLDGDDPSPISDPRTYYPDQHDCPLTCSDYTNIHSWTPYISVERLQRCEEPMLLQFSISNPLDDPKTTVLIRSCTLGGQQSEIRTKVQSVENPKKDEGLLESSLDTAPACFSDGTQTTRDLSVFTEGSAKANLTEAVKVLEGLQNFFEAKDNCDENVVFAYYKKTVASIYVGKGYGKATASSLLSAVKSSGIGSNSTIAQVCGSGSLPGGALGLFIDGSGDIVAAQRSAAVWSKGECVETEGLSNAKSLRNVKTWEISGRNGTASNSTLSATNMPLLRMVRGPSSDVQMHKRAECRYISVISGDGCASLVSKCGISAADFTKFNPNPNLCSSLKVGDYVCCSAGDPHTDPKPDPPKPGSDGTCATHLIVQDDSCGSLAKQYGITVNDIERFNKGKTWAWTECKNMLLGYNMCLSEGATPLPPPQQGAECGPLVPGSQQPSNKSASIADLNPCPLKACCSNWGFCGPFPEHCDIHAPEGGGPGAKLPNFRTTCVSNCGNEIKKNGGPPTAFQRIGYYESWNLNRDCLWLKAKNANTDGSYTHIHWGFLEIDSKTFKPVVVDKHKQWADFKKLKDVKRIVSFGGWAYSTEAATYNIIRSAIINNRETFATNIAQFLNDEGLDGVDIDWEYPGAPDILVGGQPIGQPSDGVNYLKFLTVLKNKVGTKSVSIAAPASYWYLKAFPIDRIAAAIDYIVYMTYDLHGQWDYGNPNAFDSCASGKCIRSHVNLTETRNSLSIITKAGTPNNKIFVGESSYGRSFHMATDGCWQPMCEFTGSRTKSDATPGRCTGESGYISLAEINEVLGRNVGARIFHDGASNSDIILYNGDYISYMTDTTKNTRRNDWKGLNFAGTIDWAVDLQQFTSDDFDAPPKNGAPGTRGCVGGRDINVNTGDLCAFSCSFDFCPETLCECRVEGKIKALPAEVGGMDDIIAWDELDVDLNRLCRFACKHGYCPDNVCTHPIVEPDEDGIVMYDPENDPTQFDYDAARKANEMNCLIYKDPEFRDASVNQCYAPCKPAMDEAEAEGRTTNYGCVGFFPTAQYPDGIPWQKYPGTSYEVAPAKCSCDNWLLNEIADTIIEALPIIAQIGCYILMSSLKFVLDVGVNFLTGGAGKAIDAGLDMAATAAQMASYFYPEEEDPEGAFSWWLSPCGGTELVPDEIKKVFDILNSITDGVSSFKKPKDDKGKGSGKKGDEANPTDRSKPKGGTGKGPNGTGGSSTKKKCNIRPGEDLKRMGAAKNTLRSQKCVADKTQKNDMIVTSLSYKANPTQLPIIKNCAREHTQACYHYSSVIRGNPAWQTLTCPPEAAATAHEMRRLAPTSWSNQHDGTGWQDEQYRREEFCDRDEYPPLYLLGPQSPAYLNSGQNVNGQLIRWIPWNENQGAGNNWKSTCFIPPLEGSRLSDAEFARRFNAANNKVNRVKQMVTQTFAQIEVDHRPEFSFGSWGHTGQADRDDGLWDNPCWPNVLAPEDPGFCIMNFDPWYRGIPPPYNYRAAAPPP
ncbi:carbohydrate-binding module family 24 protein [Dothidotthia symphoricarpi CBS 119687]|uniref:chitinase n=1 Tax=Dothidotthia symphoricarpi CBS 119687 TaxID=1392245 RepID=A0A6A6AP02_9PLEO|nr:carbohydrate-binding module family 24 protein [Dothidotthia symphoricarpi CBS 119687]KAF2132617.1 carbohydrate-binding module family 24 protein [Dothidotthia symphoricarpi CBS 119687]